MDEFEAEDDQGINEDRLEEEDRSSWASSYSPWEEQMIKEAEECLDLEGQLASERDSSNHKLWISFQSAACCIAQLYKDRHQGVSLWLPFQSAAGSVTALMKDCQESQKRMTEIAIQVGIQRRNKEMLGWLKKKRGMIRRDELVAFVCGKNRLVNRSSSSSNWSSPKHRLPVDPNNTGNCSGSPSNSLRSPPNHNLKFSCLSLSDSTPSIVTENNDLQTFRDALALSVIRNGPQATMTSTSVSRRGSQRSAPAQFGVNIGSQSASSLAELNAFITEEFTRHVEAKKRSSSSSDAAMSSPTHKKPKYS